MDFLKGLVLSLLSFLLFMSLSLFGDMLMLKYTLLNPDFVASQVDRFDVSSLAEELLSEQILQQAMPDISSLPVELPGDQIPELDELATEVLSNTVAELEPWMKEQANLLIHSGYDYLWGRTESLSVVVSLQPVRDSLRENLEQVLWDALPPEVAGLPPETVDPFLDEIGQQIAEAIPETFEFNQSLWSPEVQSVLEQARRALGYFELVYMLLVGFMLLLILGIFLISRQIRSSIRRLGIILLSYGVLQYVGIFIITRLAETQSGRIESPAALQAWLPQFLNNLFAPLEMFSIGVAVTGLVLIIVGVVPWGQKPGVQQEAPVTSHLAGCPRCGSPYAPGQRFCGGCGASLAPGCPRCGATIAPGSRFCTNCGAKLV